MSSTKLELHVFGITSNEVFLTRAVKLTETIYMQLSKKTMITNIVF